MFPRIKPLFIGLLIFIGLGIACSTTETPDPSPDLDATVTASIQTAIETASPDRTETPSPNIYATVQAQARATAESDPTVTAQPDDTPLPPNPTIAPISQSVVAKVRPSVVRIVTNRRSGSGFIFQMGFPTSGSGDTALVVTNYQVIENASQINVTINDLTTLTGTIVGIDQFHDLAVLKICCGQFQPLAIVDNVDPPVGSNATVFGYPTGVSGAASITEGFVSATLHDDGQWIIQTEAATNAGNSGGPLISSSGAVLGINTYKPNEDVGFAISQKTLLQRIPDLISGNLLGGPTQTPQPTATPTSLSHLAEGQRLFDLRLFDSAVIEFTQAIVQDKDFGQAYGFRETPSQQPPIITASDSLT